MGNKDQFSSHLSIDCSTCKLGKSKCLSFPSHGSRAESCFDLIHSDVWGITPVISHAKYKYFVTFIDDYNKYTWIYFHHSKSEVFSVFQKIFAFVKTQFSSRIKVLRFDSGVEYMSKKFHDFLQNKGIVSQHSCPYTPQQNGVAERKNRHLLDVIRTLLLESSVPSTFWVEALSMIVYLIIIIIPTTLICILLVVFVLSIFHLMNVINFMLNLLNVHLWDIAFRTKVMFVTIHALTNFVFLVMLFSLKINHSSLVMLLLCQRYMFFLILMS